jgi:HSP20 family protein
LPTRVRGKYFTKEIDSDPILHIFSSQPFFDTPQTCRFDQEYTFETGGLLFSSFITIYSFTPQESATKQTHGTRSTPSIVCAAIQRFQNIRFVSFYGDKVMANNLMRFNPFGDLTRFEPWKNFEEMFKDFRLTPSWNAMEAEPRIKMDVTESDNAYTVKADIPGVSKDDIKVTVEGNQVCINVEVKKEKEEKKEGNVIRSERYFGSQYRSFTLGQDVDDTKADAKYNNGVLELTLPKKPGKASKQLSIN